MRPAGEPGQLTKSCINSGDQARRTTRLTRRGVTARTRFPSVAADGRIADALTHRISIDVQLSGRGSKACHTSDKRIAGSPRSRVTKSTIEGLLISACPGRFDAFADRILAAFSDVLCGLLYTLIDVDDD